MLDNFSETVPARARLLRSKITACDSYGMPYLCLLVLIAKAVPTSPHLTIYNILKLI